MGVAAMRWMTRYPLKQMMLALAFVLGAVTCAIWLTQALRFVDLIVNRGLPVETFVHLAVLLLPQFFQLVLPIAMFSAVVFSYNKMQGDSELVVMRATGLSSWALARPALILAMAATAGAYAISLFFAPLAHSAFKDLQFQIRNEFTNVLLREGVFTNVGDKMTVYIRQRESSGELLGVMVHDERDPKSQVTMVAERGALVSTEDGPKVIMVNGNRQERTTANGRLSVLYFDRYALDLGRMQQTPIMRWREPRERYLPDLFWPGASPIDAEHFNKLIAEGHQRLVTPLFCLSFTLIGLAAMLTGEFSRRGHLGRILVAVLAVIASQTANLGATYVASRTLAVVPLMYGAVLLPAVVALWMLMKPERRPVPRLAPAE
jgi:lipopolysaccharide export system permease protein